MTDNNDAQQLARLLADQHAAASVAQTGPQQNGTLALLLGQLRKVEGIAVTERGLNSHTIHFQDGSIWNLRVGSQNATLSYRTLNSADGSFTAGEQELKFAATDENWYYKFEAAIKKRAHHVAGRPQHIRNTIAEFQEAGYDVTTALPSTKDFSPTVSTLHLCTNSDHFVVLQGHRNSVSVMNPSHAWKPWDLGTHYGECARLGFSFRLASQTVARRANMGAQTIVDFATRQPQRILRFVATWGGSEKAYTTPTQG